MKCLFSCFWLICGLCFFSATHLSAQCVPDTTVPGVPGIYPLVLPPATGCQYYEVDVTAVFPRDTVTPLGTFPFNHFIIDSITGLPDGIQWECNLAPDCKYIVHPDSVTDDTLGCIRLFGTPTVPATYNIQAWVTAELIAFGMPGDNPVIFEFPLTVSACQFVGDCYTLSLDGNCQPASLDIVNEVPSNGQTGFSYDWEILGPGGFMFTSTDEQPGTQMLTNAGSYVVNYEAIIDTIGFVLNGVTIDSTDCGDILGGAGDLYWILIDPSGTELVNTSANPINGGTDSLPLVTGITGVFLDTGTYEFQVWDDDSTLPLNDPDGCATGANNSGASVFLTIPPPNPGNVIVTVDGLRVIFDIGNPVTMVSCSDTIEIGALPLEPALLIDGDSTAFSEYSLCARDTLFLATSSTDSLQWFVDSTEIVGANGPVLAITEAGKYYVEAINTEYFCSTSSASMDVQIISVPTPAISYNGMGELMVNSPNPDYVYEWYQSVIGLAGTGTTFIPTASGDYTVVAVDTVLGCSSLPSSSRNVIVTSVEDLMRELRDIRVYPNPSNGLFYVELNFSRPQAQLSLRLTDLTGRTLAEQAFDSVSGSIRAEFGQYQLSDGLYLLHLQTENGVTHQKILIQKE